jgi:parallel beta-helix repeat protein
MAFVNVVCASPTIHTVCQSGCEYTKIQDAIDAADPGHTIDVYSGTYYENVIVNKTLTLRGWNTWGGGKPVVDAKDTSDAFTLEADGIRLENFTVTHTKDGYYFYAGIAVSSNECKIIDNEIRSNGLFGIEIFSANNTILGNNISNSVMTPATIIWLASLTTAPTTPSHATMSTTTRRTVSI